MRTATVDFTKAFDSITHKLIWKPSKLATSKTITSASWRRYTETKKHLYWLTKRATFSRSEKEPSRVTRCQACCSTSFFKTHWRTIFSDGKKKRNGKWDHDCLTNLRFADDVLLFASSKEQLRKMLFEFKKEYWKSGTWDSSRKDESSQQPKQQPWLGHEKRNANRWHQNRNLMSYGVCHFLFGCLCSPGFPGRCVSLLESLVAPMVLLRIRGFWDSNLWIQCSNSLCDISCLFSVLWVHLRTWCTAHCPLTVCKCTPCQKSKLQQHDRFFFCGVMTPALLPVRPGLHLTGVGLLWVCHCHCHCHCPFFFMEHIFFCEETSFFLEQPAPPLVWTTIVLPICLVGSFETPPFFSGHSPKKKKVNAVFFFPWQTHSLLFWAPSPRFCFLWKTSFFWKHIEILTRNESVKYLGQLITFQQQDTEIKNRIRAAWATFTRTGRNWHRKTHAQSSSTAIWRGNNSDFLQRSRNMDTQHRPRKNDSIDATQDVTTHHSNKKKIQKDRETRNWDQRRKWRNCHQWLV